MVEVESRFSEALAFAAQHKLLTPGSEESGNLYPDALLESGREDEAFEYLLRRMKSGQLLLRYPVLFEPACTRNRMDDLAVIRQVLASAGIAAGTYLLDAWGRMMKKDVKWSRTDRTGKGIGYEQ